MKLCVTANNFKNALSLIEKQADAIVLSIKHFSNRANYYFSLDEIKQLNEKKVNTKIFVVLNNFIFEDQITELETTLKILNEIDVDLVMFNDFAIPQIKEELNLKLNLLYFSNTLFTSFGQYDFFIENNIFQFALSNELFLHELKEIAANKPNNCCLMQQIHGLSFIMHSRWNLVSNFQKYVNDQNNEYVKEKKLFIRELNKEYPNIIYENEYGTHMFSGYELCALFQLKELIQLGIDYFLIDTFLNDIQDSDLKIYDVYKRYLNSLENEQDFFNDLLQFTNLTLSPGFLGSINDILHFKKINEKGNKNEKVK